MIGTHDERAASVATTANTEGGNHFVRGGAINCTVRNVSDVGTALDVISPVGVPDHSRLPCRIVWRKEKRIGVRFDPV